MMEHDRLRVAAAPVLVVDLDAVFGAHEAHVIISIVVVTRIMGWFRRWRRGDRSAPLALPIIAWRHQFWMTSWAAIVASRIRTGRTFPSMARAENERPPGLCRR